MHKVRGSAEKKPHKNGKKPTKYEMKLRPKLPEMACFTKFVWTDWWMGEHASIST